MSSDDSRTLILTFFLTGLATVRLPAADDAKPAGPRHRHRQAPRPEARPPKIAKALQEAWPDRPEWLDMYTAILDDEVMGPSYGWFRTAVTQTRFGWDATRKRYDRDGDGSDRPQGVSRQRRRVRAAGSRSGQGPHCGRF